MDDGFKNKVLYSYNGILFEFKKAGKRKADICCNTNFENITLSKRSQTQKAMLYDFIYKK